VAPTRVVGRRVAAFLIDSLLLWIVNSIVFFSMAKTEEEIIREIAAGEIQLTDTSYGNITIGDHEYAIVGGDFWIYMLIITVIGVLYWMILPGLRGWTLGKLLLGLRVVREDGTVPAGIGKNVVRQLLWIVDNFPYIIPALTGFIVAMTNDRNKRVGDLAAGTLVVRASAAGQPLQAQPQAAYATPAAAAPAAFAPGPGPQGPSAGPQTPGAGPQAPSPGPQAPSPGPLTPSAGPQAPSPGPQSPAASPQEPPTEPQPASPPADWYPDPHGQKRLRYWDGENWTDHTAD
jgi:uncharacterized RDD family membrane protein YckC